ncbi:hypothetical protein MKK84_18550 [Methylobacterium sp. E-065]|uniref:hypothetical protein n=1 Tax=Methylobacterium sp. E-065 TaxID=2836583 RepID=UPI001FB88F25|nr:hypothetical protein [Methylobacterium sp. E-065]MCJ2019413.1 hypothetical protein [Methylobacterium sp. E-065]
MSDEDAFAQEIAALLIADIKTSGARSRAELEEACRTSLRSLLGEAEVPPQIAVLMPIGLERWPRVVVKGRRLPDV